MWAAWGHLGHSVRTGDNAFESLYGIDVWTHRERVPEQNAIFNANMAALSSLVAGAVADAYDFSGLSTVVDVGGGQGVLLEAVLAEHEHLTGTVFDQAHAVATAPTPGASDSVASRWAAASGSFFESVPPADALILKAILHDWPDDRCVEILRTCARSLNDGGVVLVVEMVLGRPGHEVDAAFSDLNMLVLPGGRERSEEEFAALFDAAGLRLTRVVHTRYAGVDPRGPGLGPPTPASPCVIFRAQGVLSRRSRGYRRSATGSAGAREGALCASIRTPSTSRSTGTGSTGSRVAPASASSATTRSPATTPTR